VAKTSVRVGVYGLRETARDLEAVADGLGRLIPAAITRAAEPIVARARSLTPVGPGPQGPRDNLPHIASTLYAQPSGEGAAIVSPHPAAPILEYGGTIAPRGVPITIRTVAMAHKAADQLLPQVEQDIEDRIAALIREHGLN